MTKICADPGCGHTHFTHWGRKKMGKCNVARCPCKKFKEKIGCGKFLKNDLKWDEEDAGWICGQYYDALKEVMLCNECKPERPTEFNLSEKIEYCGFYYLNIKNIKTFIKKFLERTGGLGDLGIPIEIENIIYQRIVNKINKLAGDSFK